MTFIEKQIVKTFKPGDIIFKEEDPGTSMFILQAGEVEVYKTVDRQKVVLARLKKGSMFGEMSLIDGRPRSATVQAVTDCTCLEINQILFKKRLEEVPGWMKSFFLILVDRLRKADQSQTADRPETLTRRFVFCLNYLAREVEADPNGRKILIWHDVANTLAMLLNLPDNKINLLLNRLALTDLAKSEINYEKGKEIILEQPEVLERFSEYCLEQSRSDSGSPFPAQFEALPPDELAFLKCLQEMIRAQASANDFPLPYFEEQVKSITGKSVQDLDYLVAKYRKSGLLQLKQSPEGENYYEVDKERLQKRLSRGSEVELFQKLEKRLTLH